MTKEGGKTVLILGAGFSISAGIPAQDKLLIRVNDWYLENANDPCVKNWDDFLMFFKKSIGSDIKKYQIEDLFTIFDISQLEKSGFRTQTYEKVIEASKNLIVALRNYLVNLVNESINKKTGKLKKYEILARHILDKRTLFDEDDRISIISLNWDCYLDMVLYKSITKKQNTDGLMVDYCTYDHSYSPNKSIPSIFRKASGKKNLKILKPHGSINWGYCSNCTRLYYSYGKKIHKTFQCIKYCNKKFSNNKVKLSPLMVMPTFMKDIRNLHLRNIWSNCGIEISEASKIIFIGYSLRPEDFYFRELLARNYGNKSEILVYDKCTIDSKNIVEDKYKEFFQKAKNITVNTDGWENCIDDIIGHIN